MLRSLNTIGKNIAKFFKEPSEGISSCRSMHEQFDADPLTHLLPWEAYDEEHQIFISKHSIGFTIEAVPLVGATAAIQKEVASIYQEILEEGDSIQCMLLADHRIAPFLNRSP